MTFEGFSPEHPATVADFKPIPKDATPAEILKDTDNATNMVLASNDPTLWQKVRNLYVDSVPAHDGSAYGLDAYIALEFKQGGGGNSTSLGLGPVITTNSLDPSYPPKFKRGSGDQELVEFKASQTSVGWNVSKNAYVSFDTLPASIGAYVYKTDIVGPDGKTTAGWVQTDALAYGVAP